MKKITKMNEAAWVIGVILCSLGVALCTKANFGLSMIAAAPYIIHLKLSEFFSGYTQGASEYVWQGLLLAMMCIAVKKFKARYLLSFGAAVVFGTMVDLWLGALGGGGAYESFAVRIAAFAVGELLTALAVAFYFRTDIPLQIYELAVVEIAKAYGFDKNRVKLANDAAMLGISVILAVFLNKSPKGLGAGTVIITLVNAPLIKLFGSVLDKFFVFDRRFLKK